MATRNSIQFQILEPIDTVIDAGDELARLLASMEAYHRLLNTFLRASIQDSDLGSTIDGLEYLFDGIRARGDLITAFLANDTIE